MAEGQKIGRGMVDYEQSEWRVIQDWKRGRASTYQGPRRETYSSARYFPLLPVPVSETHDSFELAPMTADQAKIAWEQEGSGFEKHAREELSTWESTLHTDEPARARRRWAMYRAMFLSVVEGAALVLVWNAVFLLAASGWDRWRNARFRASIRE